MVELLRAFGWLLRRGGMGVAWGSTLAEMEGAMLLITEALTF